MRKSRFSSINSSRVAGSFCSARSYKLHIEVLRGASGRFLGPGDLGGTINLSQAPAETLSAEIRGRGRHGKIIAHRSISPARSSMTAPFADVSKVNHAAARNASWPTRHLCASRN
jgi:hypothetical protein